MTTGVDEKEATGAKPALRSVRRSGGPPLWMHLVPTEGHALESAESAAATGAGRSVHAFHVIAPIVGGGAN